MRKEETSLLLLNVASLRVSFAMYRYIRGVYTVQVLCTVPLPCCVYRNTLQCRLHFVPFLILKLSKSSTKDSLLVLFQKNDGYKLPCLLKECTGTLYIWHLDIIAGV